MAKAVAAEGRRRRERGSISVDEILNGAFDVAAESSLARKTTALDTSCGSMYGPGTAAATILTT